MKRGTPDHPKTIMLAMELEKVYAAHRKKSSFGGKSEAVGILEVLWDWASKYAIQGNVGKWPDEVIARGIGWTFSGKELISSLIVSHWLDEVPMPDRLVIHDIKDHATNTWRQNLEDAGLTWWDGSSPRKYKLRKSQEKLQNNSRISPQPEPQPEPQPKKSTPIPPVEVADPNGCIYAEDPPLPITDPPTTMPFILRKRVGALFNRGPDDPWGNHEERSLVEVCRRPNALQECSELERYKAATQFFPRSLAKLLAEWPSVLDQARSDKNNKPAPRPEKPFDELAVSKTMAKMFKGAKALPAQ